MSNNRLHFIFMASVKGLHFSPMRSDAVQFISRSKVGLNITISPTSKTNMISHECFEVKLRKSVLTDKKICSFVKNVNQKKYVPYGKSKKQLPLLRSDNSEIISSSGIVAESNRVPFDYYPLEVQNLAITMKNQLEADLQRFFGLLRWRQNPNPGEFIIDQTSLFWGNGKMEHLVSRPTRSVSLPSMRGISWEEQDQADIKSLWVKEGFEEPLGHELLREASHIAKSSLRSSILVACAALETGVKNHCANIAPDSAWILEKAPSPPIFRILRDYIPDLHRKRGLDLNFWESFQPSIKKISKFIEIRNKLSHTGVLPDSFSNLSEYLTAISDILYILDVLEGHEWAKEYISSEIKVQHNWPKSRKGGLIVRFNAQY